MSGPFGAGKTTLITSVSDIAVTGTEVAATGGEAAAKATTTVGIEHGVVRLTDTDPVVELLLFGTPGQARFDAVREVAARGVDGVLLVVDGTRADTWPDAARLWRAIPAPGPTAVAVNRWSPSAPLPSGLRACLTMPDGTVWVAGDVTDAGDARRMVVALLEAVLHELDGSDPEGAPSPGSAFGGAAFGGAAFDAAGERR